MASIQKKPDGRWRGRYRDEAGNEHARHFARQRDAKVWLDEVTTSVVSGTYVEPKIALTTVREWSEIWLKGYENNRPSTVRQARTHLKRINEAFGGRALKSVRPSEVKAWTAKLSAEGLADSTVYALHSRMGQLFSDAVHDGLLPKSPLSRRTAPKAGKQRPYGSSPTSGPAGSRRTVWSTTSVKRGWRSRACPRDSDSTISGTILPRC